MKKVAAFYPSLKSLPENKVKSFRSITLAEEIIKDTSIGFVVRILVFTLMKIYN